MFLFTTTANRDAAPASPVMDAIRQGAERTGTNFDYLVRTAQRESALDPDAKARTSSATGLFQFIEQTWLGMVRSEGPKHGLTDAAGAITQGADGRLTVADTAMREQVMALRRNPQIAATMAGAFTQRNREQLQTALGREPNGGDLYTAHVLGARGAIDLISTAQTQPDRIAARDFPDAAAANRGIFYERATGRARTAAEVFASLSAAHAAIISGNGPASESTADNAAGLTPRKGLMGLFSTEGTRQPVSNTVAQLWSGQRAKGLQLAAAGSTPRFFPTTEPVAIEPAALEAPVAAAVTEPRVQTHAPVPPRRPDDLRVSNDGPRAAERAPRRHNPPLDLNVFMRPDRTS